MASRRTEFGKKYVLERKPKSHWAASVASPFSQVHFLAVPPPRMTTAQATCRQCGGRLLGGDRFCAHCGAVQDEIVGAPIEEPGGTPWDGVFDHLRAAIGSKYEIGRPLGYGGMAAAVLSRRVEVHRRVDS